MRFGCIASESKQSSVEWYHKGLPLPETVRTWPSAAKIMASVFWDSEGIILVNFLSVVQQLMCSITKTCSAVLFA
jgi:hypothetical protein